MIVYRAYLETRNFDFEAYATDEQKAIEYCYEGWKQHAVVYEIDPDHIKIDEVCVYPVSVDTGQSYTDREANFNHIEGNTDFYGRLIPPQTGEMK